MEVLRGNQASSRHSRRQSDKLTAGDNRALDWGMLDSDIALFPHSPLALADVLSTQGGFLDLIPETSSTSNDPDTTEDATVAIDDAATLAARNSKPFNTSADRRSTAHRKKRQPRERFNLLTRHTPADLLKQCKKILVENALIKNKGERQLYLAAGFISWSDAGNSQERKRAPLLLYPALLVRIPHQARYELRLAGDTPEFNRALMLHTEQRFAITVPEFDHRVPLSDYLAQVAQTIRHSTTLSLEFDVALGSASLLHTENATTAPVVLPDIPVNFNVGLAMNITGSKSLPQLNSVLQLIPNYTEAATQTDNGKSTATIAQSESVAGLRKYAARLSAEGLDHVEFRQLSTLPAMISKWTNCVTSGLQSKTIQKVLALPELSSRELIRLASIIELIDKAPATIEQFAHSDLCFSNTALLMRRAQHQARLIEDELEALQEYFVLEKVPAKSQLLSLMAELGGTVEHDHDYVDADYFNARRQFMEFSIEKPTNLTTEHRRLLSQLAKVMRFRELFVNNTEYRAALGPAYKGLRTDWTVLAQMSEYARELSEVLESETVAAQILANWHEFRAAYSVELEALQAAADGCRRLLGTLGTRWQTQSASALCNHAIVIQTRLTDWQNSYGNADNHADKTPAIVLSSFSGKSRDDVVVETQADETRTRIDRQLQSGAIRRDQVIETLKWLLDASTAASEGELEIDAIVEHLQVS